MKEKHKTSYFSLEDFLRKHADAFELYPKRKTWYSIYNNIHPSKKWPSIGTSILLLACLLWIGTVNTKEIKPATSSMINSISRTGSSQGYKYANRQLLSENRRHFLKNAATPIMNCTQKNSRFKAVEYKKPPVQGNLALSLNPASSKAILSVDDRDKKSSRFAEIIETVSNNPDVTKTVSSDAFEETRKSSVNQNELKTIKAMKEASPALSQKEETTENNQIKKSVRKNAIRFYITPSVSYRTLRVDGRMYNPLYAGVAVPQNNLDNLINQSPSIGAETGVRAEYPLNETFKFSGGVQINFNRYTLRAYDNGHPFATAIPLFDDHTNQYYHEYTSTDYSSFTGNKPIKLHNQQLQLSIPLAVDMKLMEGNRFSWFVGAGVQPTIVLYNQQYLLSSDFRNYVKDASLTNRFNLNATMETFISYQKDHYLWQIGPQFRQQLFTTNTKSYGIQERTYSVGIKIGVSKKLGGQD